MLDTLQVIHVPASPGKAGEMTCTATPNKGNDTLAEELFGVNATQCGPVAWSKVPVLGMFHQEVQSLVGFDPLLTCTPEAKTKTLHTTRPTSAPTHNINLSTGAPVSIQNLSDILEIPPLAEAQTPPPKSSKRLPFMKKRAHRKTQSLTGPMHLTGAVPIPPVVTRGSSSSNDNSPLPSLSRKAVDVSKTTTSTPIRGNIFSPWSRKGHHKTGSGSTTAGLSPPSSPRPDPVAASLSPPECIMSMSPMIQELFQVEQEATSPTHDTQMSLFVPSLAKPRPTSFLTGQEEVVRSSEQDPTPWQLEMPSHADALTCVRLCEFLDTYRSEECLLDLQQLVGLDRMRLSSFARGDSKLHTLSGIEIADCHRSIVESLLECGNDVSEVKGFFTSNATVKPDHRREVLVVERQNKFLCIFRGTIQEQQGKIGKPSETCELKVGQSASVFVDRYSAFADFQSPVFQLLDRLSEEYPFCDIAFTGHMFGATMATIAAHIYANTRTALRVSCMSSSPARAGLSDFRWAVHSTPNLNMCRLQIGGRLSPQHVGHCLRLTAATSSRPAGVHLLKFGGIHMNQEQAHHALMGRSLLAKPKEKDLHEYVSLLEDLFRANTWVKDYYKEDGIGVRGKDNEARQMA